MTGPSRALGRIAAVGAGVLLGAAVIFGIGAVAGSGDRRDELDPAGVGQTPAGPSPASSSPGATSDDPSNRPDPGAAQPQRGVSFLAWAPGSLPAGTEARLEALPQVRRATTVYAGLDWIVSSHDRSGRVDRPPAGYAIPFEVAAVNPRDYAPFVAPRHRSAVLALGRGEAVLAATATELRGASKGLRIDLGERDVRVIGSVSDVAANGYEALLAGPPPAQWTRADRFVLAQLRRESDRGVVERVIESLLPAGQPLQTRVEGENPFLRYGDAVLPQLLVKETFGEFAARPLADGTIDIEKTWERRNIRSEEVPILGKVTCHRVLFPQLEEALRDIQRRGLDHVIHPRQYSGCFSPRFIGMDAGGRLSHHSWGMAIDLNAEENPFGTKGNMDMRLVDIFEDRWGFTWGGRWIVPDAMHFEWIKFP